MARCHFAANLSWKLPEFKGYPADDIDLLSSLSPKAGKHTGSKVKCFTKLSPERVRQQTTDSLRRGIFFLLQAAEE